MLETREGYDEENETRTVRGMGQRSYRRERDREGQSKVAGHYLVLTPCASVPRTYCRKRRGHMAWAIAMALHLQSRGGRGSRAAGRSTAV